MTTVGKLLVIMNLAMSICFCGFAVAVYNAREDMQGQLRTKNNNIQQLQVRVSQAEAATEELDKKLKDADAALAKLQQESAAAVTDLKGQVANLNSELQKARTDATSATAGTKEATTEQVQRQKEVESIRNERNEFLKKNSELISKNTDLQDLNSQLKNDLDQLQARNLELDEKFKQLSDYVVRVKGVMPEEAELQTVSDVSPPPNVEGVVLRVDSTGKMLEISIGSDDGIRKGQNLQVWRTKPVPKYLGQIQIVQTTANTAVAKPVSVTGLIQENDQVGPRIIGSAN